MTKVQNRVAVDTATIYQTTTAARPAIVCPSWCDIPEAEHIADLAAWEGMSVHSSNGILIGGARLCVSNTTTTDGAEDLDGSVMFNFGSDDVSLDDAETALRAALALIEEARRAVTVVRTPTTSAV
jgi:hypothetical protein